MSQDRMELEAPPAGRHHRRRWTQSL